MNGVIFKVRSMIGVRNVVVVRDKARLSGRISDRVCLVARIRFKC